MSVDAVRKLVEGPGCFKYLITIGSVIVVGTFIITGPMCGKGNQAGQKDLKRPDTIVAKVGDFSISAEAIDRATTSAGAGGGPLQDVQALGQTIDRFVRQGVVLQLATKNNVTIADADLIQQETDRELQMDKIQLMINGKLKDASDAGFDDYLKKNLNKTSKELKADMVKELTDKIKDPDIRSQLFASLAPQALETALVAKLNPSEEEVKRQFDTLTLKRIFINGAGKDDNATTAKKALADLKGGLGFEAAMNRYSKDPPAKGKTVSELTLPMQATSLVADPGLSALLKLKPGEMSEVIDVPGGIAIYKLISVKSGTPPDYDKKKSDYRKTYNQNLAHSQIQAQIDAGTKDPKIEWMNKAYQAVYDYSQASKPGGASADIKKQMQAVLKEASESGGAGEGERAAALARYAAESYLYGSATPTEKKTMSQERIETITEVLRFTEGADLRIELADLYEAAKQGPQAADNLTQAARANNDTDALGQSRYNDVNARLEKYKKEGLLSADEIKNIEKEQTRWKKDRAERDQAEAEKKKFDEEDRKRAEADKKKAEADAKAKPAVVPKIRVQPSTGK